MQINKALLTIYFLHIFCSSSYSQQNKSSIHVEKNQHNFGQINEGDGKLQHDFYFTNKGKDSLIVINVKAGGGISVVLWTRSPVMPGDSGIITVEFNPENMPGRFNRSITVDATGNPSSYLLRLLGEVIPVEKKHEELFPRGIGLLRLRSNHIFIGHVAPGSVRTDSLQVINVSEENLDISFSNVPVHATIRAIPSLLKPGESGVFKASWDAGQADDWGVNTYYFKVLINGVSPRSNIVYLSANIQEDFSGLSDEEKKLAPVINFEERIFDFGRLKHGEKIEYDFVFSNEGKSDLIIRRVRAGCGCTATEPEKSLVKPGESSIITIVFNSYGLQGRQSKGITVISNDPSNPNVVLRITGEVISE